MALEFARAKAGTTVGMRCRCFFRAIGTAAVLSAALSGNGWAQDAVPAERPKVVRPPKVLKQVDPVFAGEQGTVVLSVVIDAKGVPGDVRVLRSLGFVSDERAIEAVKRWRFKPGNIDGHPVSVAINVVVNFHRP